MLQPHLVLLLDWMREKANGYTRGANSNVRAANEDTDQSTNRDGDSYLDAHFSGYRHGHARPDFHRYLDAHLSSHRHGHAKFHCHLDAYLSGYEHGHIATLVEQLAGNILA